MKQPSPAPAPKGEQQVQAQAQQPVQTVPVLCKADLFFRGKLYR